MSSFIIVNSFSSSSFIFTGEASKPPPPPPPLQQADVSIDCASLSLLSGKYCAIKRLPPNFKVIEEEGEEEETSSSWLSTRGVCPFSLFSLFHVCSTTDKRGQIFIDRILVPFDHKARPTHARA